jgi:uncharacterized protein (TIGR02118 family)
MIKGFVFLPKRKDISTEQFHRHWLEVHAPMAQSLQSLRRYIQSHKQDRDIPGFPVAPWQGIAEIWFDDLQTGMQFPRDPGYRDGLQKDEPNFLDVDNMGLIFTREYMLMKPPAGGVKVMFLAKRKTGMEVAEFRYYWLYRHAVIVANTPRIIGYQQCHTVDELYNDGEPLYDGVAELWWTDVEAFEEAWRSRAMQVEQAVDLAQFIDLDNTPGMMVREAEIIADHD